MSVIHVDFSRGSKPSVPAFDFSSDASDSVDIAERAALKPARERKAPVTYSITYSTWTPEDVAWGEASDSGYEVQDKALSVYEDETEVQAAVDLIRSELGHVEASSSRPREGMWFTASDDVEDYRTGVGTQRSIHFDASLAFMTELCEALKAARLLS